MGFLTLNGYELRVAVGQARRSNSEFGASRIRAHGGALRSTKRGDHLVWTFTTPYNLDEFAAELYEGLILGKGHHWPFDSDLYSDKKGLGPELGYSGVLEADAAMTGAPKCGTRCLLVADSESISFDTGWTGDATVMVWHSDDDGATWVHRAIVYDVDTGAIQRFSNGVRVSAVAWPQFSLSAGVITLEGVDSSGSGAAVHYDDLVFLPFRAESATSGTAAGVGLVKAAYDNGTTAWSNLPQLLLSGDCVKTTTPIPVIGSVSDANHNVGQDAGSMSTQLRSLTFSLEEVG